MSKTRKTRIVIAPDPVLESAVESVAETLPVEEAASVPELPYFVLHGKDAEGPFTPNEIREQLMAGQVRSSSYCWNQTMSEWMPLHAVFDFATPSEIDLEDGLTQPLAGFGRRFGSGTIDLFSIMVLFEMAMFLSPSFRGWVEVSSVDPAQLLQVNLILGALIYVYFMLALGPVGGGATMGYRLCGLRLVDQATRRPPSWTQALLWCLGSISLPIGWPFYWFDRQHRMLHNGISQTLVVDVNFNTDADGTKRSIGSGGMGNGNPYLHKLGSRAPSILLPMVRQILARIRRTP